VSETTISTIIPAYNASRTIARAIDSVIGQTRPSTEILVIDDGSSDDLAEALRPFERSVTLIRKPNGGAASARNMGIEFAQGDLIAFLDADDYWEPTKLDRQVAICDKRSDVGVTATRYFTQHPGQPRQLRPAEDDARFDHVVMASGDAIYDLMEELWTSTVVVRRKALNGLRFVSGLEPAEDRDLWIRLIAAWPVYLESEPLATYVLEPGSLSRTNVNRDYSNMLRVIRRHSAFLSQGCLRAWESHVFQRWAAGHLGNGLPEEALAPAFQRLRLEPTSPEAWWIYLKCHSMRIFHGYCGSADQRRRVAEKSRSVACHRP
jgi:glycosyltransferase involved in cell wall biosynthesis